MNITLKPIDDQNREAVLALSVRDDQPFVASNARSLEQARECNEQDPGVARPFAIYAGDQLVGFAMLAFDPRAEDPYDRYCLWRLMIDQREQGKGYGQAALAQIIRYFRNRGADMILLSTEPANEVGLHVYQKLGFARTGEMNGGEAVLKLVLRAPEENGSEAAEYEAMPCTREDAEAIEKKIEGDSHAYAPAVKGASAFTFCKKVTDDAGNIIAGCSSGMDSWNVLNVGILWVAEPYRRQGIGTALLREAERTAREKGSRLATLGTFDFQAKDFCEKLGYEVYSTEADHPKGHTHYHLSKQLDEDPQEAAEPAAPCEIQPGDDEDAAFLDEKLYEFNLSQIPSAHEWEPIEKKFTGEDGKLIAGCVAGVSGWNTAYLDLLWVEPPCRGQGLGSDLLRRVEQEAKEKGAACIFADAYSWQVGFFRSHGYLMTGALDDCPKGHCRLTMKKVLKP